jgi:hypothetical protein
VPVFNTTSLRPWHWLAVAVALLTIASLLSLAIPHLFLGHETR